MQYHKQLFGHDPANGVYGDCQRTALACILDKHPSEVPHFGEHFKDSAKFHAAMDTYLATLNLAKFDLAYNSDKGLDAILDCIGSLNKTGLYMIGGLSRRGVNHVVVARGDTIIWDPHSSGSGLVGPCDDGFYWVTILTPLL